MGANLSKEELLYQAVRTGNHDIVKALHREGTSLEWIDKEGRTPLLLACSRAELLDMTITLLNLGSDMNAFRSGSYGGFPLHFAAKRGLDKTVTLLLSRGANPIAVNDDNQTPLDMARSRGHVAVVRLLEERLCLFSGMLREVSSFSFLETVAPKLVTRKIWAVVLPSKKPHEYELAIYESPKVCVWTGVDTSSLHPAGACNVAQPSTVIPLAKVQMEKLVFNSKDLGLQITDNKTKYKFLSEKKGDRDQVDRLYDACKGIPQWSEDAPYGVPNDSSGCTVGSQLCNVSQIHPLGSQSSAQPVLDFIAATSVDSPGAMKSRTEPITEEIELALALDESLRTAAEEGIPLSPNTSYVSDAAHRYKEWDSDSVGETTMSTTTTTNTTTNGSRSVANKQQQQQQVKRQKNKWTWGPFVCRLSSEDVCVNEPCKPRPTAPPLMKVVAEKESGSSSGTCVICWDAWAEGVCIPCGHLAGCMSCLMEVEGKGMGCPVCRGPIQQIVKVYAV